MKMDASSMPIMRVAVRGNRSSNELKEIADDISYASKWNFNGNCSDELNIHLFDINDTGSLNIAYDYQTDIYSLSDIKQVHSRIVNIIEQILKDNFGDSLEVYSFDTGSPYINI